MKHYNFGKYVMYEKLLTSGISYLDVFLIGYFLNFETLGAYDVLKKIILRPFILANKYLEDVVFSLLSRAKESITNYNKTYRAYIAFIGIILFTALSLIFINSQLLLELLPPEYAGFNNIVELLVLFTAAILILNPLDMILYRLGKSKLFFKWYGFISLFQIVITFIAIQYSISLFLISISIYFFIAFILAFIILIRKLGVLDAFSYYNILFYLIPFVILIYFTQMLSLGSLTAKWIINILVLDVAVVAFFVYKKA